MSRWTGFLLSVSALWTSHPAMAKDFSSWKKYTQADLLTETSSFSPGANGTIGFKIKLAPGWHTYWLNPGDSGTPMHMQFKTSAGTQVKQVLFPYPKREQSGPLISFGYENEVLIPIELTFAPKLKPGTQASIDLDAEWLVCEDVCIPAFQSFHLDLPITALEDVKPAAEFGAFQQARTLLPRPMAGAPPRFQFTSENKVRLPLPHDFAEDEFVDFFPFRGSGVIHAKPELTGETLNFEKSNVTSAGNSRVGLLMLKLKSTGQIQAIQFGDSGWTFENKNPPSGADAPGIWWMLFSAFVGGLILNLMPCVFPILSIKLLSLIKLARAHPREVRVQNLAYVVGVLLSFLSIALVLSVLRSAGHLIGWGFQLQSPVFLSLLSWLFFALSLNLLGVYEFDILNANWGHRLTRFGGVWGSFFTGVLAVVVASPCTAPFMGVALGFGLAQPTYILLLIFLVLGLGLAFPYLLFALFPAWARIMPKPGAWMKTVKQVMAFPLLLTTLWMLWILAQVRGADAILVVLAGCVALGFAFWLSNWGRRTARILAFVVLALGVLYIYRSERPAGFTSAAKDGLWQDYSEARMLSLKGRAVFIDMTADWCLTCKVNERLVFDDLEVQKLLQEKKITLLKGDWTERNEEITRFLNRYQRVGVPFYVLYSERSPEGRPLPEVLTKSVFLEAIQQEFP